MESSGQPQANKNKGVAGVLNADCTETRKSTLSDADAISPEKPSILVGRLGRDPEVKYTSAGGQAVANFSLATDEPFNDRNGERQKRTEWHKIVLWGKQTEVAGQYLRKGSLVFVEGKIKSREWEDKQGQKRTAFEIVASNFRMLADVMKIPIPLGRHARRQVRKSLKRIFLFEAFKICGAVRLPSWSFGRFWEMALHA
jgi:single-strand DNA-binding protein